MHLLQVILCVAPLVLLALLPGEHGAQASRILFGAPVAYKSHIQFYSSIVGTLARQGHEITFVTPYGSKAETPGVREIALPHLDLTPFLPDVFESGMSAMPNATILPELCVDGLQDPQVQQLLNETFDLMMMPTFWSECFLVLQHYLKIPLVLVSPVSVINPTDSWFGNPNFPSYDINIFLAAEPPLSFGMRMANVLLNILIAVSAPYWNSISVANAIRSRGLLPEDMPPNEVFFRNASLLILNSFRTMETPKAYVPNIIHAGGLNLRPTKPLPQDLEEWAQRAGDHGFIYFSLGSVAKTSDMPEKHMLTLVRAFSRLPQKVLMKWNEDHIEGLSPNVRLAKWLPQQDVLAHPKARLFITHGGLNSVQEALYHGVPILGMPLFSDQKNNMEKGARQGWALCLHWHDLTEESLMSTLDVALNDTRVRDKASRMGTIIRDLPMTPADTVIYWVEYVLRHGGARHLRCPAADMSWFFLYNCDIWLTVVTSVGLVTVASFILLRCLLRRCCRPRTKSKSD